MIDPSTRIAKLKAELASGTVVIVVGSGVSVAACGNQEVEGHKVATWKGLLEHGARYLSTLEAATPKVVDLLIDQINSGETDLMIHAAEAIERRMTAKSEGTFRGWLKQTIGQLKIQDSDVLDAVAALPGLLTTLNYDHLLEQQTGQGPITWKQADAVQDILRGKQRAIIHLHGHFEDPESIVLGVSSYNNVKDNAHASSVLRGFFIQRTVMFIGCGNTVLDPNFSQLIEWGKEALQDVDPRHVLLCRATEEAAFHEKLARAPWLRPLAYGEAHDDLGPFLRRLAPSAKEKAVALANRPAAALSLGELEGYRQAMENKYWRLKLEEVDATSGGQREVRVSGVFIGQNAKECAEFLPRAWELPKELQRRLRELKALEGEELEDEELEKLRGAYISQSPRPILEVVEDPSSRKVVVLGDPGSGKSLLLQALVLRWAERMGPMDGETRLPLLIELRDYARLRHQGEVTGFLEYLSRAESIRWQFEKEGLERWLRHNPSRVMFDGLDEVFDPVLRREVATAIHRFADTYPSAQVLVSSRVIGFQHQSWGDEGFRQYMLQELDDAQIETFLRHWHQAAYEDGLKGERKQAQLTEALAHSPAIHQLAGNPLLLTMMAILNRTQELPRDRSELYNQCARLLLHQWKTDAAFTSDPALANAHLNYKDKRELLMRIAWSLQASPKGLAGNLIEEGHLERTLIEGLRGFADPRPDRVARALIKQLRGRNFMLCSVGGDNYAFVHRTFLEYFCAVAIVARFESEQTLSLEQLKAEIFGHWADETWHEVLTLVAGDIEPKFLKEILLWLLERPDPDQTCETIFLAARCVGEVRKRQELGGVDDLVLKRLRALTRFDLNHFYEPWGDEGRVVDSVRQRAVRLVSGVWRDKQETEAWLKTSAQSDEHWAVRRAALQELARGWKDLPDTLTLLQTAALSDNDEAVRQTALQELARGWKDLPGTLTLLQTAAQSDKSYYVRQAALQELARGWKDLPDTLTLFQTAAQSDHSLAVREAALQELARGWKDLPGTLTLLQTAAQSDEHWRVRQAALQELARGRKDLPDTLSLLQTAAQSDKHHYVRQAALQELVRGWKDLPDTLSLLQTAAQSDNDKDERRAALQELARGWKDLPATQAFLQSLEKSPADPSKDQ